MFNAYTTPIADICKKHQVLYHRFADDIQLNVSYNAAVSDELEHVKQLLIQCIGEIRVWMLIHQLKLNNDKTESIPLQSPHNLRVSAAPAWNYLDLLYSQQMQPGIWAATSTDTCSYCSSGYYHLRVIGRVRHLLPQDACHAAVRSLVLSRLDFCNGLFGG